MQKSLCYVFIHQTNSWYLKYTIGQILKSNPNAYIILIGDNSNNSIKEVNHLLISDFSSKANDLRSVYRHLSLAPYEFELFCFQRWFILLEFMEKHGIEESILIDSDVLIFQELNKFISSINEDFHFTQGIDGSMGFVYFKSREILGEICNFIISQYTDLKSLDNLELIYNNYKILYNEGGISDITLFKMFCTENMCKVFNIEATSLNGMAFINSLESNLYRKNKFNIVDITWHKSTPYATLLNGKKISVIGVHCFGLQKKFIRKLYHGEKYWFSRLIFFWKESELKKIYKKTFIPKILKGQS